MTHFALGTRVPVVVAAAAEGLDTPSPVFGEGGRRRSAFGLTQEFLNATDEALWGLCCDGITLRLLRDNASLTRPAWIEADLARIFTEDRYADFAALWLLLHESRFGSPDKPPSDCALEAWRAAGREEGTRARDKLRAGVEAALLAFGQGFVAHPDNGPLREALRLGQLSPEGLYQQLLRLVYRLIFLLTAEERGVLHAPNSDKAAQERYAQGYSLGRLRERSVRRSAHDRHHDLWEALRIVFVGVGAGQPRLALPALGGLFATEQCPHLDAARLSNSALLTGVFKLSWLHDEGAGLSRVNWRDMGPEELGSVYESLLELVPQVELDTRRFAFATGDETRARRKLGAYFTPDSLVQVLLDSALEPVVADTLAAQPADPVEALLSLSVVDPACGSGHFLLAAARRLAAHVARLSAKGSPSAAEYRHALRQVVSRCIYGVDLNPMALELCRVSLWMEAVEPGRPLSFLDAHLQHGNALLGATPALLAGGIPDAAWEPIEGDDKKIASALKKRNKQGRSNQPDMEKLWSAQQAGHDEVARAVERLDRDAEDDLGAVQRKASTWGAIQKSSAYEHERFVADAWCAAFVWPKSAAGESTDKALKANPLVEAAPVHAVWDGVRRGVSTAPGPMRETVRALAAQYHFFHWHLAFPQVFKRGGFDVVLGNPPWEHVEIKEQEWFAERRPDIAQAANASKRKRLIEQLAQEQPKLLQDFLEAQRNVDAENQLVRSSGRFPLCARGRINTYALFAEHNRAVLGPRGRAGFIVPSGIATDETTKDYFKAITTTGSLHTLWEFENEGFFSAGKGHMLRFALMTIAGSAARSLSADFLFQGQSTADISDPERHFSLRIEDIEAINPNTGTCPIFRTKRDASLSLVFYRRAGVLWREDALDGNPWNIRFMQGVFNMASDSGLFHIASELQRSGWTMKGNVFTKDSATMVPLYEAKMVQNYNHRSGSFEGFSPNERPHRLPTTSDKQLADPFFSPHPCYWVNKDELDLKLAGTWEHSWLLGWRDVTDARASARTLVSAIIPRCATNDGYLLAFPGTSSKLTACLLANLSSFPT